LKCLYDYQYMLFIFDFPVDVLLKCLSSPHFNRLMSGFYVRICVAENVYRIALIVDVIDQYYTKYMVDHKAITDKGLLLLSGKCHLCAKLKATKTYWLLL
jgi:hypothetical protein